MANVYRSECRLAMSATRNHFQRFRFLFFFVYFLPVYLSVSLFFYFLAFLCATAVCACTEVCIRAIYVAEFEISVSPTRKHTCSHHNSHIFSCGCRFVKNRSSPPYLQFKEAGLLIRKRRKIVSARSRMHIYMCVLCLCVVVALTHIICSWVFP